MTIYKNAIGGDHQGPTFIVAAADSLHPGRADYVCDGVDDDVEIQAAIDALTSGRTNKQRVLCVGNFVLGENINLPSYTILEIDGSLKAKNNFGYSALIVVSWNAQVWEIVGGEYNGNKANCVGTFNGIAVRGTSGGTEYGDFFGYIRNVYVKDCTGNGIVINSRRCRVDHAIVSNCDGHGFFITTSDGVYTDCNTLLNSGDGWRLDGAHNHFIRCFTDRDALHGWNLTADTSISHDNVIVGGFAEWVGFHGVRIENGCYRNSISHLRVICNGGYGIYIASDKNQIFFNSIYDSQGVPTQDEAIYLAATASNNVIFGNSVEDNTPTKFIVDLGTNNSIRNNFGYTTENSGTATLLAAGTTIVVTHGLAVTPAAGDIMVTPMESLGNASFFWVDTYTSTQFTIHTNAAPGADTDFAWRAIVL
jgi:hypothetical protein